MSGSRLFFLLTTITLTGCAGGAGPVAVPEPKVSGLEPGYEILWVRDSAEYEAALVQTYRLAGSRLEAAARDKQKDSWTVVLDADETVLSNLAYSVQRAAEGGRWSEDTWREWVLRKQATAIPGAIEFTELVRRLGGRVAIVTNRSQSVCQATRENLEALGVLFDHLRCRRAGEDRKEGRWQEIRSGEGTGLGPLEIVMWVGDNIRDFPELDQSMRMQGDSAYSEFGGRFFVLPNPLYGSWEER